MVALPPPSQPTVDAIYAAREAKSAQKEHYKGYGISASEVGQECDRRLWYTLRWSSEPEVIKGRILRIFERGDIEEERIVADLRRAGLTVEEVDPQTGGQWRFALANGWLRGKADGRVRGVLEAPKAEHVIEIKSMKASDYRAIQKHGLLAKKPEHWHQLHSGMAGLGIDRGLYIAVNKDTEEIFTTRLHLDFEIAAQQEARVLQIAQSDEAPAKINDNPEAFACRFCKHKGVCHDPLILAERSCRTCIHWTFGDAPNGFCSRFDEPRRPDAQQEGCPAHLFLPDLVPGEQIDADPEAETITYQMESGGTWIDGGAS